MLGSVSVKSRASGAKEADARALGAAVKDDAGVGICVV